MEIAKQIIVRACTLPRVAELANYWNTLLEMIADSSPVLWEKIKDISPSAFQSLDQRTRLSVLRYFNRAKFRPIPYGKFASVGTFMPAKVKEFTLNQQVQVRSLPDWSASEKLAERLLSTKGDLLWRVQSTLYSENGNHYFFQSTEGQTELFCIDGFTELNELLAFCQQERSTNEIKAFAQHEWDFYKGMLHQLAELQVLVHSGMPNITGQDYFERLQLNDAKASVADYEISFRNGTGNALNSSLQNDLLEYVKFAANHIPNPELDDLSEFKKAFTHRYENQWQPLALVLNPSRGIGYAGLSNATDEATEKLLKKGEKSFRALEMNSFNNFLLAGMVSGNPIDLKDFSVKAESVALLPNTMSALVQKVGGNNWQLDHLGGATANSLLGRFAVDEHLGDIAQSLAEMEQKANLGVLFFDVAYQTQQRTDNINRRPQLYDAELTLGGWSTHPCQLQLADIFVNVINGQLVLYSAQHQRRLVPRIASAYNTLRSSNPLLRLLADLQYQQLHMQFLPELSGRFPDMDYYPEVRFGKLIIQSAMWRVKPEASISAKALVKWLHQSGVVRFLKVGHADQYLCLDMECELDRGLLLDVLQRDQSLKYVSAWLTGEDGGLADQSGKRFTYQLQLNLKHGKEVYQPVAAFERPVKAEPSYLGGEWFYVSLYVTSTMQDTVLTELIRPLITRYAALLDAWFYVLYRDPEQHIRLRLKWKVETTVSERWEVEREIGAWLTTKAIRDMAVKPYHQEIQRYGSATITLVEDFFCKDSEHALADLLLNEQDRLHQCCAWMKQMINFAIPTLHERKDFAERMATSFAAEMGWNHSHFKLINQEWRERYHSEVDATVDLQMQHIWAHISAIAPPKKQQQLLADLIHMHINRRFASHARLKEAQLYQYLLLYLQKALRLGWNESVIVR